MQYATISELLKHLFLDIVYGSVPIYGLLHIAYYIQILIIGARNIS